MKKVFSICAALLLMSSISFANGTTEVKKRDICVDFAYAEAADEAATNGDFGGYDEWLEAFNFYYSGCLEAEQNGGELVVLPCYGNGC